MPHSFIGYKIQVALVQNIYYVFYVTSEQTQAWTNVGIKAQDTTTRIFLGRPHLFTDTPSVSVMGVSHWDVCPHFPMLTSVLEKACNGPNPDFTSFVVLFCFFASLRESYKLHKSF